MMTLILVTTTALAEKSCLNLRQYLTCQCMRYDCKAKRFMLLYPPKGLVLNSTEIEVVQLCVSGLTVGSIIEQLASRNGHDPVAVEREVTTLLTALLVRGLIHEA